MKAALLEETGRIVTTEMDTPGVGPEDILIKVAYAGICGSDLHAFRGHHPFRKPPVVLGHELSGTVAEMGAGVHGFARGDRVTVMPAIACGVCLYCRRGRPNICVNKRVPGIKGWVGTFAEYFSSRPEITYKLGEHTSLQAGALAEPLAVGVHSIVQARMEPGASALVLGGGTIGLVTAVAARAAGAGTGVVTDLYDYNLGVARALGADATFNARDERLVETILAAYPVKFETIFLTSGAPSTVDQALRLIQRGGRIVVTALFTQPVSVALVEATQFEVEIIGTQIYNAADFQQALDLIDSGKFPLEKLIDHVLPLEQAQAALEMISERRADAIKVLLTP